MDEEISFQPVGEEDYDFLWRLHRKEFKHYVDEIWGWDEAWQANYFRERFDRQGQRLILYRGKRIGTVKVIEQESQVFLAYIAITSEYQRRGIGSAVLQDEMERAQGSGKPVVLRVLPSNPAQKLYARLGFVVTESSPTHIWMQWTPD